ncbi:hypothetical protein ACS0TY_013542 [Phlomoides rotata]
MAETEVSKEVSKMVAIEEKCVLDMSSYQDLPKPDCNGTNHHNQASDLDNSYVFVSGADGVTGNEDVEAEDPRVLPESDAAGVEAQGAELHSQIETEGIIEQSNGDPPLVNVDKKDVVADDLSDLPESDIAGVKDQAAELHSQIEINDAASGELNEAANAIIELGNGDLPLVNADDKDVEAEGLSVLPESSAAGVNDQEADLHSQIDNGEFLPLNEAENSIIEQSNGDPPLVKVDDKDVKAGKLSVQPEPDAAVVKDQGVELHSQIEKIDAVIVEFQPLNEAENSITERSNGNSSLANIDNKVVEAEGSSVVPEFDTAGVKDQGAELHSQLEKIDAVNGNFENNIIDQSIGDSYLVDVDNKGVVEAEGSSVLPESEAAGLKDQEAELHSQIENIDEVSQPPNEEENCIIEAVEVEESSEKIDAVNGNFENNIIDQSIMDSSLVDVDNKGVVEAEGSSVLPESEAAGLKDQEAELHSQIENIDEVSQPPNEEENCIIEAVEVEESSEKIDAVNGNFENNIIDQSIMDSSLVDVDNKGVVEAEGSSVLPESEAAGLKDQEAELHSQIENIDEVSQPPNEEENCIIEAVEVEESSEKIDAVNGNFENNIIDQSIRDSSLVDVDNKGVVEAEGSSVMPESEAAGLKDQEAELHSQIENIDEVSQPPNEEENCIIEAVEVEESSEVFEPNAAEIKDQGAELCSQNESFDAVENRNVEQIKEDPTSVKDSTSKHESFHENGEGVQVSLDDPLEHTGETETETEVKDVQDPDEKIESLAEAEVEKALGQNGIVEDVAEGEEEKFDNASKAESSTVVTSGLVAESGENRESNNILLHVNNSLSADGECEDRSNLCVTEALEARHESQVMVVDVVQRELQDVTVDIDDEIKSGREVVEPVEYKVSPSTSLDLELVSHAVQGKAETLDEEAKTTLSSEVLNQQDETAFGHTVQGLLGQMDESKTAESCTDSPVQTVCNLVVEEQNENIHASEVDNGVQYPEETNEQLDSSGLSHDTIPLETKSEASMQTQSNLVSDAHAPQSEISDAGIVVAAPIASPKSQITENLSPSNDSGIRCLDEVVLTEKEPTSQGDEAHAETEVSSGKDEAAVCPSAMKLGRGGEIDDVAVSCRTEVSDSFNVNKEAANVMLDVEGTEDIRDRLDGTTDSGNENLFVQENKNTGNSQCNKIYVASAGGSSVHTSDGKEQSPKIKTKPFNFLIRVPRFNDENLREQIRVAKIHVDEKTKLRDAVQIQIQEKRANSQIHGIDYEYAKSEARSVRKLVRSKRMEIDSLQSVINKAKNALSIEDIDSQIYNMEHMIQHETLPLKEEKQLIREIKQLKQLREQLSSNMGSKDEIKQAIEQRGEVEERLKILRKELDILKNRVLKAEATATEAEKKYDDENKKVKEFQAQFRAADDVRQAAYAQWQNLRKELSKKSEYFFKYKDDAAVASNYAYSRDTEALYLLCMNQVDNFMELWNTNDEFRREYAKFNTRSTVRRFGTLDGRALGPDEVPPHLPSYADERERRMASTSVKVDLASRIPSPEVKQETPNENTTFDNKVTKKATESNYQKVTKEPAISVQANGLDTHFVEVYKEPIRSKDEIESLRREEEKRREEAEAKLKEQRRVEALAKANEARERKKRQAEKLQMRADLKTQKEAEQREKEREKRLRKKERKKGAVTDGNDTKSINCESGPSSESAAESSKDIEVVNETVSKKQPQKPWWLGKQSKAKSIPPPLRNRNKKKLQQWMWVGVTSVMILVLFWLGNIGVFSNVALKRRGTIH